MVWFRTPFTHTSFASHPPAPLKKPPPNALKKFTPLKGPFLDIFLPLLIAPNNSALSLWGVERQKRFLRGEPRCANMNSENMKTTNCPNAPNVNCYNFFYSKKIFFVMYGTEIDHCHRFLAAFSRAGGHTTL